MLVIYTLAIECCGEVGTIAVIVEKRDRSLADQMRRAMASVALNMAEGSGSQGKNQNARYYNALGSAREVTATLDVAVAFGYIDSVDPRLLDKLDKIRATLHRILHPRGR